MTTVVVPDTHDQPRSKRNGKSAILLLAVVGVCGGLLFGQLTAPPPLAAVQTTTTVLQAPVATQVIDVQGFQPAWASAGSLGSSQELAAIHRIGNRTLLFTTTWGHGVVIYEYAPGAAQLLSAGAIPEAAAISRIIQSRFGIHLFGHDRDGVPTVWASQDGLNWHSTALTGPGNTPRSLHTAHASDDLLIAVASANDGSGQYVAARVAVFDRYGDLVEDIGWHSEENRVRFVLVGPLRLVVDIVDAEDLGLDPDHYWNRPMLGEESVVWVSRDGINWRVASTTSIQWFGEMFTGPDGRIWVNGYDGGSDLLATSDGETWVKVGRAAQVAFIREWRDGYLARSDEGRWGLGNLAFSSNGEKWIDVIPGGYLSDELPWGFMFGGSDLGIAAVALARSTDGFPDFTDEPPSITRDRFTLTAHPDAIVVEQDGVVVSRVERSARNEHPKYGFDLSSETVGFFGSTKGAAGVATFPISDLTALEALERDQWARVPPVDGQAFFFSTDAENWIVQDIGGLAAGQFARSVHVVDDTIFLVSARNWIGPWDLWVTTLPESVTGRGP